MNTECNFLIKEKNIFRFQDIYISKNLTFPIFLGRETKSHLFQDFFVSA